MSTVLRVSQKCSRTHNILVISRNPKIIDKLLKCIYFFLSFSVCALVPTHCRCKGGTVAPDHSDTHGTSPLDERSVRRRDLYLITRNAQTIQTPMPPAGFESEIPTSERRHTHVLNRVAPAIRLQYFILHCIHELPGYYIMFKDRLRKNMFHVIKRFK
jgi:hypothetical protein